MVKAIFFVMVCGALSLKAQSETVQNTRFLINPLQIKISELKQQYRNNAPIWIMKIDEGAVSLKNIPAFGNIVIGENLRAPLTELINTAAINERMVELNGALLSTRNNYYMIVGESLQAVVESDISIAKYASTHPGVCQCQGTSRSYEIDPWMVKMSKGQGSRHRIDFHGLPVNTPSCLGHIYLDAIQRLEFENILRIAIEQEKMLSFNANNLDISFTNGEHTIKDRKTIHQVFAVSDNHVRTDWRTFTASQFRKEYGVGLTAFQRWVNDNFCCNSPTARKANLNCGGWQEADKRIQKMSRGKKFNVNVIYLQLPAQRLRELSIPLTNVFNFSEPSARGYEALSQDTNILE